VTRVRPCGRDNDRVISRATLACLGSLLWTLLILPASAHAATPRLEPANGSHVAALPKQVAIPTHGKVKTAYVMLRNPDGLMEQLKPTVGPRHVTAPLPSTGPRGEYEVAYRLIGAGGRVTPGTLRFVVDRGRAPRAAPEPRREQAGSQDMPIIGLTVGAGAVLVGAALLVRRLVAKG
jgi:methionine-rich copper-binding protein CopC